MFKKMKLLDLFMQISH